MTSIFSLTACLLPGLDAEPVSYSRTVAPLFRAHCVGCHRPGSAKGKFDLSTYGALRKPGKSGPALEPGRGADSLLVKMMTGEIEPAMPKDADRLDNNTVDRVRRWIDEGAKFDGAHPDDRIDATDESTAVGGPGPVTALAFHPKTGALAVGVRGAAAFVDAHTGKLERLATGAPPRVHRLAFSKSGDKLLVAGGSPGRSGKLLLLADGGPQPKTLLSAPDVLYAAAFSPDETLIATAGADRVLSVLDAKSHAVLHKVEAHADAIRDLAFHTNGRAIATASRDRTIKLWDRIERDVVQAFREHADGVYALAFGPKGERLFSAAADRTLRTWRTENGKQERVERLGEGPSLALAVAPVGDLLALGGADGVVRLRKLGGGEIRKFSALTGWIYALAFSADGKLLAVADSQGTVGVFDAVTGALRVRFEASKLAAP